METRGGLIMCWRTYYGMLSVQRTATKDIHVKKAFIVKDNEIRSLFFSGFRWTRGILRKTYLGTVRRFNMVDYPSQYYIWSIEEGFHSAKYVKIVDRQSYYSLLRVSNGKKGVRVSHVKDTTNIKILNCIIPKGSKYYVNEYGEYVSDQLIVLPNK